MPPPSTILHIQSALEATTGTTAQDTRNEVMYGATRLSLDPDLESQQKELILSALSPLENASPSIKWTPFEAPPTALLSPAFLTVSIADDGSTMLRSLSCPKPVAAAPTSCISISSQAAFTRVSDPLPPVVFSAGDIEFTKSTFPHPIDKLCTARLHLTTQQKQQLATYLGDSLYAAVKNILPFRSDTSLPFNSPSKHLS